MGTLLTTPFYQPLFRQLNGNLQVVMNDNTAAFKSDATFNVRYGLAANTNRFGISFESVSKPGYYMGHAGSSFRVGMLKLANTALFKTSSTWTTVAAPVSFLFGYFVTFSPKTISLS